MKDTLNMPIDTYILCPSFAMNEASSLPRNIHFLKGSGNQQIQGITIGTCSEEEMYPIEDLTRMKDTHFKGLYRVFSLYMYVYNDPYVYLVHNLICLFAFTHLHMNPGMDILITSDWPREFYHFLQDSDTAALRKDGKPGLYVGSAYIAEVRATVDIIYLQ